MRVIKDNLTFLEYVDFKQNVLFKKLSILFYAKYI